MDRFMTNKELVESWYNIKSDYQPIIETINTLDFFTEYFGRIDAVMRGIIDR